jgi:MoxR-like ATPase
VSTEFVPFESIDDVSTRLSEQSYICSRNIATVVFLATRLGKPVLVEGPAGVGKTELAKVIATATSANLIRMQCYEGLDEAKALYEWEYAKQLLYTQILKDKIQDVTAGTSTLAEAVDKLTAEDDVFFSQRFILARPLLQAIESSEPSVLLIDEIDKADAEFEAFLLEILSEFQVTIPEIGTIKATTIPMVILTSNNAREMSDALKRRCLHLYIDFPTEELEREILRVKVPEAEAGLAAEITSMVQSMRNLDLKKAPSISETLDWARALVLMNVSALDQETANETLSVVLKYEGDLRKGEKELKDYANKKLEALNKAEADSQEEEEAGKQDSDANGGQLH